MREGTVRTVALMAKRFDTDLTVFYTNEATLAAYADRFGPSIRRVTYKKIPESIPLRFLAIAIFAFRMRDVFSQADRLFFEGFSLVPLLIFAPRRKTTFSLIDALSLRFLRFSNDAVSARVRAKYRIKRAVASMIERFIALRAKTVHVVSKADAEYLRTVLRKEIIMSISVPLGNEFISEPLPEKPSGPPYFVAIAGNFLEDHILSGATNILTSPEVNALFDLNQDIRLLCVGQGASTRLKAAALAHGGEERAQFIDFVDNYVSFLDRVSILLLPDQSGSGQKNRTVQAAARQCVLLGNDFPFEGLSVVPFAKMASQNDWGTVLRAALKELQERPDNLKSYLRQNLESVRAEHASDAIEDEWAKNL